MIASTSFHRGDENRVGPDHIWNAWREGGPGGETSSDVSIRIGRLIARLSTMHRNIALFSHGQLGVSLAARWIGLPTIDGRNFILHTASLSTLGHDDSL